MEANLSLPRGGGELSVKRGESLVLDLQFTDAAGYPLDLSGATITAQARDRGALIADLPLTPGADPGEWTISVPDTSAWPDGVLVADLRVVLGGLTELSDSFQIRVLRPVTQ